MRRVVLQMGMSLDGFVARRASSAGGWGGPPEAPAIKQRKLAWMAEADAHLVGRTTYEEMASHWPFSDDAYAAPMNELPKVVFSTTLQTADWEPSRIARGDLAAEVAALKSEPGRDLIAWGGATFAQSLSRLGLIDEYRLTLKPVALGEGLPLFKDLAEPLQLELVDAQTYETGAAVHIYRPR